ncbi:MAG: efflux RND transporter permease subunit [Chlamydiales bacterium]
MSSLSEPFIRRPVMTTLMMLSLLIAGLMAYRQLPVSDLPNVDYPVINVRANLTGASPEVMANTVAAPLEREFMTIPGLKVVKSTSSPGSTYITLEFDIDKRMDDASLDVQSAIARAEPSLPKGMSKKPVYYKQNPSQQPIIYLALTSSTLPLSQIYEYANNVLGKRISMIEGVANVQVYGPKHQIDIRLNPHALILKDLSIEQIKNAVVEGNPHLPSGDLVGETTTLALNTQGQLIDKNEYAQIIIKKEQGSIIRLDDVADVSDGPRQDHIYFKYIEGNKEEATVILAVQRLPGANSVAVSGAIQELIPQLKEDLPQSLTLVTLFDRAHSIRESIADVQLTLLIALALVVGIIYFYLGKGTDTLIPSLVLPMSLIGTYFIMYFLGFSIDNLSLLALTLSIGFVVDDAIVVVENIVRHIELGEKPFEAAVNGAKQISFTVLSMTLSLTASFIPLLFLGGLVGKVFREFAITISSAILISGFVSLSLTPMLCSLLLKKRDKTERKSLIAHLGEQFNERLLELYRVGLNYALKHQKFVLGCGVVTLLGTVALFKILPMRFLPGDDIGYLFVSSKTRVGSSPQEIIKHQKQVTDLVKEDPAIEQMVSWVSSNSGQAFAKLKEPSKREATQTIVGRINQKLAQIPGIRGYAASIPLLDLSLGDSSEDRYFIRLKGPELAELANYADLLVGKMRQVPGFHNVTSNLEMNRPQLEITLLRDHASIYQVTAQEIQSALLNAYSGHTITHIELPDDQYDVTLGVMDVFQKESPALNQLYVKSRASGKQVPLASVAKWKEIAGPRSIHHVDQFPAATVGFSLDPSIPLNEALSTVKSFAAEVLPPRITWKTEGVAEAFESTFSNLWFLIMIAVLVSYIVLGTLYESFIHPFTILSSLPLAAIGGLITLWVFGESLSLYSLVGLILLIGIVKKNGIIMIDYAIEAEHIHGKSSYQAIYEACLTRFRPMMMTTFAAIMGALPIAIGIGASGAARRPLGLVIVGGLLLSQMLTLFLTPVVFLTIDRLKQRLKQKRPTLSPSNSS